MIGEQLPGHGVAYLAQNLTFCAPVRPDDLVRAEIEVLEVDLLRQRVTLATRCLVDGAVALDDDALVLAPSRAG